MDYSNIIQAINGMNSTQSPTMDDLNRRNENYKLVDQLNPQLVFFERELCKLGPDDARRMELLEFNVPELDGLQRIQICCSDSIRLSVADLKNLEPFVIFTEEVNGA